MQICFDRRLLHPFDVGTQCAQLGFHLVITPVQMVDAVDPRFAISHQGSNHQTGRGPQICRRARRKKRITLRSSAAPIKAEAMNATGTDATKYQSKAAGKYLSLIHI